MSSSRSAVSTSRPGPEGDHTPRQQQDLVVFHGLGDVVGRGDEGRSALELGGEGPQVAFPAAGVEPRGGLVEHDEVGSAGQHLGQVDALLLAARERPQRLPGQRLDPHGLHPRVDEVVVVPSERSGQAPG